MGREPVTPGSDAHGSTESRVYLLTLWREDTEGPWRAALRPTGAGPRLGFADLEHLAAYLLRMEDESRNDPSGQR